MAIFSKPARITYTCYELGHTWTPSCKKASIDVLLVVFKESLKIYGTLYMIAVLFQRKGKEYLKSKLWKEVLQSSLFLSTNGMLFITFFCVWRKLLGCHFYLTTFFIPAVMASFVALLLERRSRRSMLAFYMANVALETAFRMLVFRGIITPVKHGAVWLFSFVSAIYLCLFRNNSLPAASVSAFKFLVGPDELPSTTLVEVRSSLPNQGQVEEHWLWKTQPIRKIVTWLKRCPKHDLCQHFNGCAFYITQGFLRNFSIGYAVQCGIKLLSSARSPRAALTSLVHKQNFYLGAFLGCYSAVFRGVNCLLRWLRNHDSSLHGLLAGFLAGWSMLWYKSSTVALYAATKLAERLYFKGIEAGMLPYIKCADIIIYSISTGFVFHTAMMEPHNLRPAYWSFLNRVTGSRIGTVNRRLLEKLSPSAAKMLPNFWPDYDPRFTNLVRPSIIDDS
ncbi:hypothetical protein ScPMuIL_011823 [Solemya velum]